MPAVAADRTRPWSLPPHYVCAAKLSCSVGGHLYELELSGVKKKMNACVSCALITHQDSTRLLARFGIPESVPGRFQAAAPCGCWMVSSRFVKNLSIREVH